MRTPENWSDASELAFRAALLARVSAGGNLEPAHDHSLHQCILFGLLPGTTYEATDEDPNSELAWRLRLSIPVRAAFLAYYLSESPPEIDDHTYVPEPKMRSILESVPIDPAALPDPPVLKHRLKLILLEIESWAHKGIAAKGEQS